MWWDSLSVFSQITFIVAVTSTVILAIAIALVAFGAEDADLKSDATPNVNTANDATQYSGILGLRALSLRSVLILITVGAWVAFSFDNLTGWYWALVGAVAIGFVVAVLVALLIRQARLLEATAAENYNETVGKIATVYVRVPKENSGKGRVSVKIGERVIKVDAVTYEKQDLLVDSQVMIVELADESTALVVSHQPKDQV